VGEAVRASGSRHTCPQPRHSHTFTALAGVSPGRLETVQGTTRTRKVVQLGHVARSLASRRFMLEAAIADEDARRRGAGSVTPG